MESIFFGSKKGAYTGSEDMLGLFEQAHNGTLFLDEINSMNILLQAKLLRVLQEKKVTRLGGHKEFDVNCRIISSLNKDPFESIQNGKLRDDLFYRLSTVILEIPPLRERKNDLDELTLYFIKKYNEKFIISITGISDELNTLLSQYDFPGNVRELQHMMESAFNLADPDQTMLEKEHLPKYILRKLTEHAAENISNIENIPPITIGIDKLGDDLEKKIIVEALIKNHYNVSQSAKELDISRQKLQYRIKKHQIPIAK